jgi:hypothetical protein
MDLKVGRVRMLIDSWTDDRYRITRDGRSGLREAVGFVARGGEGIARCNE